MVEGGAAKLGQTAHGPTACLGSFQAAVLLPVNVCWQTGAMFGGFWSSASPVTGPEQGLAPNLLHVNTSFPTIFPLFPPLL